MRKLNHQVGLCMLLLLTACTPTVIDPPPDKAAQPLPKVAIQLDPLPGNYAVYRLDVSVTTEPDHQLFFGLDAEPQVVDSRAYNESFSVRLVRSTRLFVSARSPDGVVHGPYEFQYGLTSLAGSGTCHIAELPDEYYRKNQSVPLSVQYVLPAAAARVEIGVNGLWKTYDVEKHDGALSIDIGPFDEGAYAVECRVVFADQIWMGNTAAFVVDATLPSGAWVTENFVFDQYSWRNVIHATAADALSGLAAVDLCNTQTLACIAMSDLGGGTYAFATALTDGSSLTADVYVRLEDRAGNVRQLPQRTLDFSLFADPVPTRLAEFLQPITLTAQPEVNLDDHIGSNWVEAWRFDGLSIQPGSPAPLVPGWNEFLYRASSTGHWHTWGIYHSGVEVSLPPTAGQWLVFSSIGSWPGVMATLEDVVVPPNPSQTTPWARPWFAVPNFLFVEDLSGLEQWTDITQLFVDGAAEWIDGGRVWAAPAVIDPVPHLPSPAPLAYARTVSVSVAADLPSGEIFFQWRTPPSFFPVHHQRVDSLPYTFPLAVSVPADGLCLFFLDVSGHGIPLNDEPRAWQPCSDDTFLIDRRSGPLTLSESPGMVSGVTYAGTITGVMVVTDGAARPLLSYPTMSWRDLSGDGVISFQDGLDFRYPGLRAEFRIYHENESVTLAFEPIDLPPPFATISASVTDSAGTGVQALIMTIATIAEDTQAYGATDVNGFAAAVPVTGPAPYTVFAVRDGYLSQKAVTDGTGITDLRLFSASETVSLRGVVTSATGPLANAELVWENDLYYAQTRSDENGHYAVPVSGGEGTLTVSTFHAAIAKAASYALSVTADMTFDPEFSQPALAWPMGLGQAPQSLLGPGFAALESADKFYTATVTGPREGTWMAEWDGRFQRFFSIQGALPPSPSAEWAMLPLPSSASLQPLRSYARCGDIEQLAHGVILTRHPCWHWLGDDGLQTYALGRQVAGAYPEVVGLGIFGGTLSSGTGFLADGEQLLELRDQILPGRTLRVRVTSGVFVAPVGPGVYEVWTSEGTRVFTTHGVPATVTILPEGGSASLLLP